MGVDLWALLAALLGALLAAALGWWQGAVQLRRRLLAEQALLLEQARVQGQREAQMALQAQQAQAAAHMATAQERVRGLEGERAQLLAELQQLRTAQQALQRDGAQQQAQLQAQLAAQAVQLDAERSSAQEKIALLQEAREALAHQFKSLAGDILEEKSRRFAEQNQQSLGQLLDPLRLRLGEFQGRVEQFYDVEGKQRSALAQQVQQLLQLNQSLSEDAKNLTQALKGSTKAQGNWGELILERVLESCGLRRGHEYDTQESHQREDGSRAQPDVVIHLPEGRHLVIDAKASLRAYEEWAQAEDEAQRAGALRRHLESVRQHIKGLAERNYQQLYSLGGTLDFVLMFVPVEPAFMLAVTSDNQLYSEAWNKNVLLVSPSTLLFVLRTVAHLWRQEAQTRNAQEIAQRGADLYDHLTGFVEELEKVGRNLGLAHDAYHKAFNRFSKNRGNVIRRAEMLKELGIKPAKALPAALVEAAREDEPAPPEEGAPAQSPMA